MEKINQVLQKIPNYWIPIVFILGAFALYGNTLGHDYALDDSIVISKNEFTKNGFSGIHDILSHDTFRGFFGKDKDLVQGGRYRPLSLITFAIEYEFFGENPHISHFVNVLLYAFLCWVGYLLVFRLFALFGVYKNTKLLAILSAVIFLIHPLHTEVVANIKGRDEILSLLFSLLAFLMILKSSRKIVNYLFSAIFIFFATMSKENAVSFIVIIPFFYLFKERRLCKEVFKSFFVLLLGGILFLVIRVIAIGGINIQAANEIMNNPFLNADFVHKIATIIYTYLIYFKLLLYPHPLTYDYYPFHIQIHDFSSGAVWSSIFLIITLVILTVRYWRKYPVISFSILGFALSFVLVSNLVFPIGTFMNERFMFMPSFFYSMLVAYLLMLALKRGAIVKGLVAMLVVCGFVFYPIKTITRNKSWKDDYTLFTTDVKISANSAKSNCSAGGKLWERAKTLTNETEKEQLFSLSEKYLLKAVEIYPDYVDALLLLGNVKYDYRKDVVSASECYLKIMHLQPDNPNVLKNMDIVLWASKDAELQARYYHKLEEIYPNEFIVKYKLGLLYGRFLHDLDKGIAYFEKASELAPNNSSILKDLGTAYGMKGDVGSAYEIFMKALALSPYDSQLHYNIYIALGQMGKAKEAEEYLQKSKDIK